jgi:hypothetical protein
VKRQRVRLSSSLSGIVPWCEGVDVTERTMSVDLVEDLWREDGAS